MLNHIKSPCLLRYSQKISTFSKVKPSFPVGLLHRSPDPVPGGSSEWSPPGPADPPPLDARLRRGRRSAWRSSGGRACNLEVVLIQTYLIENARGLNQVSLVDYTCWGLRLLGQSSPETGWFDHLFFIGQGTQCLESRQHAHGPRAPQPCNDHLDPQRDPTEKCQGNGPAPCHRCHWDSGWFAPDSSGNSTSHITAQKSPYEVNGPCSIFHVHQCPS